MKDRSGEFLLAYKDIELICRAQNKEVKDLETELGAETYDSDACRLRICRQIRNFIVHNDNEEFLVVSPGMIKFLKEMKKELKSNKNKKAININHKKASKTNGK